MPRDGPVSLRLTAKANTGGTKSGLKQPTLGSKSSQENLEKSAAKKKDGKKQRTTVNRGERPLCEDWKAGRSWLVL